MDGADTAPVDLRFLARGQFSDKKGRVEEDVRADVASYLSNLYESVAEVLPDIKDDAFDENNVHVLKDAYALELNKESESSAGIEAAAPESGAPTGPTVIRKSKPRKMRRGVRLNSDRLPGTAERPGGFEVRKLPPSPMKEYWEQYRLASPLERPASFPTFWRASRQDCSKFPSQSKIEAPEPFVLSNTIERLPLKDQQQVV